MATQFNSNKPATLAEALRRIAELEAQVRELSNSLAARAAADSAKQLPNGVVHSCALYRVSAASARAK